MYNTHISTLACLFICNISSTPTAYQHGHALSTEMNFYFHCSLSITYMSLCLLRSQLSQNTLKQIFSSAETQVLSEVLYFCTMAQVIWEE